MHEPSLVSAELRCQHSGSVLTLRLSGRATPVPHRAIGAALESAEADP